MSARKQSRVVVVTGASAGVGRATVRAFAGEGAYAGLIARDTEGLHVAACEVEELGGKALAVPADVADAGQVENAAARIENELGAIEVWVNNAMTTVFARVGDVTPAEFKRATEVTYLGRTGFDSQQTQESVPKDRPDNLFEPLPGDFGARGMFGQQAHEEAATTWLAQHKATMALPGANVFGVLAFALKRLASEREKMRGKENGKNNC